MFLSSSNRIFHLSLQNICFKIMKRRLYIFSIWIAMMGMLLSTVMLHHHHYERICMVVEVCSQDGSLNDEHTEHHDTEHEGCQVKQMHHFIVKNRVVKSAVKSFLMPIICRSLFFLLKRVSSVFLPVWQQSGRLSPCLCPKNRVLLSAGADLPCSLNLLIFCRPLFVLCSLVARV